MAAPDPRQKDRQEGWAVPIDRIDAFTSGAAMAVDLGDIEKELAALWRQAAERAQAGATFAVIRACLWNLIVQVGGAELRRMKPVLDELSEGVPTRLVVVVELSADDPGADVLARPGEVPILAYVEANTRPGPGGRREVVSEEITLEAPRSEARRLPGLVRSLMLADLPTAMFLPGGCGALRDVMDEADRLIIDSGRMASAGELLEVCPPLLSALRGGRPGPRPVELADLGWVRLQPWRVAVAGAFDAPEALAALLAGKVSEIEIRHVVGSEAAALLLAGWMMSRLGWRPGEARGGRSFTLRAGDGPGVRLRLTEVEADPAVVQGARAAAASGIAGVTLQVAGRTVPVETPLGGKAPRDSELLALVLGAHGRDPLMPAALRHALGLLGAAPGGHP